MVKTNKTTFKMHVPSVVFGVLNLSDLLSRKEDPRFIYTYNTAFYHMKFNFFYS